MNAYSPTSKKSSKPNPEHGDAFARQAVLTEFRPRDGRALDQANFRDRAPHERPHRLGDLTEGATRTIARRAVRRWLREAALALTQEEREEALSIARNLSAKAGLCWLEEQAA